MGFSRQEYWSGFPCPLPGDLPDPGTEPVSLCLLHWQMGSIPLAPPEKPLHMMNPLLWGPAALPGHRERKGGVHMLSQSPGKVVVSPSWFVKLET